MSIFHFLNDYKYFFVSWCFSVSPFFYQHCFHHCLVTSMKYGCWFQQAFTPAQTATKTNLVFWAVGQELLLEATRGRLLCLCSDFYFFLTFLVCFPHMSVWVLRIRSWNLYDSICAVEANDIPVMLSNWNLFCNICILHWLLYSRGISLITPEIWNIFIDLFFSLISKNLFEKGWRDWNQTPDSVQLTWKSTKVAARISGENGQSTNIHIAGQFLMAALFHLCFQCISLENMSYLIWDIVIFGSGLWSDWICYNFRSRIRKGI